MYGQDALVLGRRPDPGGKDAFGLAFVEVSGSLRCETVSSVDEAAKAVTAMGKPLGLGIDAPMWWSAGEGGGRMADKKLRDCYHIQSGTIQSGKFVCRAQRSSVVSCSLHGSGRHSLGFASRNSTPRRCCWHCVSTECNSPPDTASKTNWGNEHERDAAIAAVCAREGFEGRWPTDLAKQRDRSEQNPRAYWLASMAYFWPEAV